VKTARVAALIAGLITTLLVFVACGTTGRPQPGGTSNALPTTTRPSPGVSATGSGRTPVSTVHGDTLTVDASISYDGFRNWAAMSEGVAIVRVVEVGPIRWNSASGDRPPEARLHTAPRGHRDSYNIGRLVVLEPVQLLAGEWPRGVERLRYWRPGGSLGVDRFEVPLPVPDLAAGDEAVALLGSADAGADDSIPVQVGWLFPIDDTGRVVTLDRSEGVTLDNLDSFLPQKSGT